MINVCVVMNLSYTLYAIAQFRDPYGSNMLLPHSLLMLPEILLLSSFYGFTGMPQKEEFTSICTTLWASWFYRNKQIFMNDTSDSLNITVSFNRLVIDYSLYSSKIMNHHPTSFPYFHTWSPLPSCWVKVNVDVHVVVGAYRGLGAVIWDDRSSVLMAGVHRVESKWSVDVCEVAVAQFGCKLALRFGYNYVNLEGDSMNVVSAIENKVESPPQFIRSLIVCFDLSSCLFGFNCSFVRRDSNMLVHLVTRCDTGLTNEKICTDSFP